MIVVNGSAVEEQYFDKCAKYAIALLGTLDFVRMSNISSISKQNYANILSQISMNTKALQVAIDNMADVESIMNISRVSNLRATFSNERFSTDTLMQIQDIMKSMMGSLTSAMDKVKDIYSLPEGALSLYSYENIESGINFLNVENKLPVALMYFEGKMTLKAISSMFNLFSSTKTEYDDKKNDMNSLTINSVRNMLQSYLDKIDSLTDLKNELEKLIDGSKLAMNIYTLYNLDSPVRKDLFLNREYSLIKEDVKMAVN